MTFYSDTAKIGEISGVDCPRTKSLQAPALGLALLCDTKTVSTGTSCIKG